MSPIQILSFTFGFLVALSASVIFLYPKKVPLQLKQFATATYPFGSFGLYNESLADELKKDNRILCWVLTYKNNYYKAKSIKETWATKCDKLIFITDDNKYDIDGFDVIEAPVKSGRDTLWGKTRFALQYIYDNHFNDADWFLKADDDSFYIIENVRYLVSMYHTNTSLYFGHRYAFQPFNSGYMAGGGYILSKKALEKFVNKIMNNTEICNTSGEGAEDLELGKCMENHTFYVDERDEMMGKRFFPMDIYLHFDEYYIEESNYYYNQLFYESLYGVPECCSDTLVNRHYVIEPEQYVMNYLIYKVHPFGINKNITEKVPRKLTFKEVVDNSNYESRSIYFNSSRKIKYEIEESEMF